MKICYTRVNVRREKNNLKVTGVNPANDDGGFNHKRGNGIGDKRYAHAIQRHGDFMTDCIGNTEKELRMTPRLLS